MPDRVIDRVRTLARISQDDGALTRLYLTGAHRRAAELIIGWMTAAGLDAGMDAVGNVVGRWPGTNPALPALVLGSHFDSVRDAGMWDGNLGIVAAIECVERLLKNGPGPARPLAVIGFADEEGARFSTTLIGSRAVAGTLQRVVLAATDADGISMAQAMRDFGLDPERIGDAAWAPGSITAYAELHIEQGPVLDRAGLPVGVVTAIAGATRLSVEFEGRAGHAGTEPMAGRLDALAAAAEAVLAVESACSGSPGLVGTVGMIAAAPGAVNVIPGRARISVDIRSGDDAARHHAVAAAEAAFRAIAARRGVGVGIEKLHDEAPATCAPAMVEALSRAVAAEGIEVRCLQSGAGHDAMAMAEAAPMGMLFVRSPGGLSHHPDEAAEPADIAKALDVLCRFIGDFDG